MAVLLLLLTFALFIGIDYFLSQHRPILAEHPQPEPLPEPHSDVQVVDGFTVPKRLRYHHGHAWVYRERKNVARVGIDEFGSALAGRISSIRGPQPGQWIRQGQKVWTVTRNGETTEMVSPIEGEVVEVNTEVLENPALLREDPYGKGWLLVVHVPDEESTARNLLPDSLVPSWMRNCAERLYRMQPQLAGLTAADGGIPADDLLAGIPGADWRDTTRQFFLS
jgi:glycine cleavage system H lipoate-binding protein